MKNLVIAIVLVLPGICWAGEEYQFPKLIEGSGYESNQPKFTVIGRQKVNEENIIWVVTQQDVVLNQNIVNQVIKSITKSENEKVSQITFYTSVHNKPKYPAFRIFEHLGLYVTKENKTYFGVAANGQYGGWSYGPQ